MEYKYLGNLGLKISQIGFGAEPLGGTDWGIVDEQAAISSVKRAIELGVTYFDTADVYGLGRSEHLLSRACGSKRHDLTIATKFGVNWHDPKQGERANVFFDSRPERVVEALENSLRRLRLDTIPLYYIHWPDPNTPIEDTLGVLTRCIETGKIRAVGLSNFSAPQIREASQFIHVTAVQVQYNLLTRQAESDIFPLCVELDIPVFTYGTLAQGLLTGKYDQNNTFENSDRRHRLPHFQGEQLETNLNVVGRLRKLAEKYSRDIPQVAVRWVLENSAVACAIVGAKTPLQVDSNCGASGWNLDKNEMKFLEGNMYKEITNM